MRLIARYLREEQEHFVLITLFDEDTQEEMIEKSNPTFHSIAHRYPTAIWFERKIFDDFGVIAKDAFDKRPLLHQERFPSSLHPLTKDCKALSLQEADFKPYKYEAISGDGVFQVSVGPIHAGIIEPGHFHFSQAGEEILHLEVRHFYKHRGIEKMLEGKRLDEAKPIIERISGNESIAYQICWSDIYLQASRQELPLSLQKQNAILLEIERIIHHLTDIGFIPNDAGFGAALSFASKLSEDARRVMEQLTNSRFGFGAVTFNHLQIEREFMHDWLDRLQKDIIFFEDWIIDIPSLWDRFDTTGILPPYKALKYGVVGVVARASGVAIDCRDTQFYKDAGFEMALEQSGDVGARFKVRLREIANSTTMIRNLLRYEEEEFAIESVHDGSYHSFCESSIGELFMSIDIQDGVIERFFVRDPSFINWQALHIMMQGNIIADFPLINKSCDLSYAGSDL